VRANPLGVATYFRERACGSSPASIPATASTAPTNPRPWSRPPQPGRAQVQELYRRYVGAFITLVRPRGVTLASETNPHPRSLASERLCRAGGGEPGRGGSAPARSVRAPHDSIQADVANGRLPAAWARGSPRTRGFSVRTGLRRVLVSVPGRLQRPGRDSPRLLLALVASAPLPLYLIEGGWPSTGAFASSPRAAPLHRAASAPARRRRRLAWFQITFTDLDVAAWAPASRPSPLSASWTRPPTQGRAVRVGRRVRAAAGA
jgi:hypothetical protein